MLNAGCSNRPTIAVFLGDTQYEYSTKLIKAFYDSAAEEDINLIVLMRSEMSDVFTGIWKEGAREQSTINFASIYNFAKFIKPDAIIVAYGSLRVVKYVKTVAEIRDCFEGIPCVLLEEKYEELDCKYVVGSNYDGMSLVMKHLIEEHGYRKIVFLAGPEHSRGSNERLRAYKDALNKAGVEVTENMVRHGNFIDAPHHLIEELLDNNPGVEAIVSANDTMVNDIYKVCKKRGLIIGKDIAVTGFDDMETSKALNPPLTSLANDMKLMCKTSIKEAILMIKHEDSCSHIFPGKLMCRRSCGCKIDEKMLVDGNVGR